MERPKEKKGQEKIVLTASVMTAIEMTRVAIREIIDQDIPWYFCQIITEPVVQDDPPFAECAWRTIKIIGRVGPHDILSIPRYYNLDATCQIKTSDFENLPTDPDSWHAYSIQIKLGEVEVDLRIGWKNNKMCILTRPVAVR